MRQCEIVGKGFLLFLRPAEHRHSHVQALLVAVGFRQTHAQFGLRPVALLVLQSRRQRGLEYVAEGRHIIFGYPSPQPHLLVKEYGLAVLHGEYVLHHERRFVIVRLYNEGGVLLRLAQRHGYAHAEPHLLPQPFRHGVGEQPIEGQRQYHVYIFHPILQRYKEKMKLLFSHL